MAKRLRIALLEPYFSGSHAAWAEGYQRFSRHAIRLFTLTGKFWKWRMHGGAVTLASQFLQSGFQPDLIFASGMLDLNLFLSLTRKKTANIPALIYFHENQLNYPWSPDDSDLKENRDNHYAFINYASALAADRVYFNSHYHRQAFLDALPGFLSRFPDYDLQETAGQIARKSTVLYPGIDLKRLDVPPKEVPEKPRRAVVLWNHRWEYDKNPDLFFHSLETLKDHGIEFKLIVLGRQFARTPEVFNRARALFEEEIIHWGYEADDRAYARWLHMADILPVTSNQDFFGISVVEAMYCNCIPLLPYRLAYPEHIPENLHRVFFYQDDEEFVKRLQRLIMDVRVLRKQNVRQFIEHYDWRMQVEAYDKEMESVKTAIV